VSQQVAIRRVRAEEAALLQSLRLAALQDAPDSFTETYTEAAARPAEYWTEWVTQGASGRDAVIAVAEHDRAVGISTGYVREPGVARLAGMWVAPPARGTGISAKLVEYVVQWARDIGCKAITLGVTETNTRAFRLYEKCGFHPSNESYLPIRPGSKLCAVQMIRQIQPS